MTVPPDELATYKGSELCQYLDVFFADRDGEIRGSERVRREKLFKAPSSEQLNRADIFYAVRRMFERMNQLGGSDRTILDLISTVRSALEEAANIRGHHEHRTQRAAVPSGAPREDHNPGE